MDKPASNDTDVSPKWAIRVNSWLVVRVALEFVNLFILLLVRHV